MEHLPPQARGFVPQSEICSTALIKAHDALPTPIFNHSVRVFLLARLIAMKETNTTWTHPDNLPLLFTAAVCHDLGAGDLYNGEQRFEIEGADAAVAHLQSHGISDSDSHKVWTAIAVHTSPGIAERIDPLSRLIRLAVKIDFSRSFANEWGVEGFCDEIEGWLPRLDVEKSLGDAVVKQAKKISEKAQGPEGYDSDKHPRASWPGILLRAHLEDPEFEGINPAF